MKAIDFSLSKSLRKAFLNNDFLLYGVFLISDEYTKFNTQPYTES